MKIGLFFGSFNPVHVGHLIIANHVANYHVDEVWFIVSPQNPFKNRDDLLDEKSRLSLVKIAISKDDRFRALDIEFTLPVPSFTINTLKILSKKYTDHEFFIILGSDAYAGISKWKSAKEIINTYKFIIYDRAGFTLKNKIDLIYTQVADAPLLNISSTNIRNLISEGKSFRYLVSQKVYDEIKKHHYFK